MPKQVRIKKFEMDGVVLPYAPLTLEQVEAYVAPLENIDAAGGAGKIRSYDLICNGLNNALPADAPEADKWTPTRVRAELDLPLFDKLRNEILLLSGFAIQLDDKVAVPGESSAAANADKPQEEVPESSPASTSGTSAAA